MSVVGGLQTRLDHLEEVLQQERAKTEVHETEKVKLRTELDVRHKDSTVLLQVMELYKQLGSGSQETLLKNLGRFVTYGLQVVFGENYGFSPTLRMDGKDLKVEFFVETDELRSGVAEAKGGGVAEVVGLLLQVFFIVVLREKYASILILDTPMVHISDSYRPKVSALLQELSEKLSIQVVLLANTSEFGEYADKVYEFTQEEGKTVVEER